MILSSHIFFIGGDPDLNDPRYCNRSKKLYFGGKTGVGDYPNPCTLAYGQVRGGVNCHQVNPRLWFSGDPVTDVGWICTAES